MKIGIVGQGVVGKNMADDFEARGFPIVRYSLEPEYVDNRKALTTECTIVFIAVPTPTTKEHEQDLSAVREALTLCLPTTIAVIKSTVLPGTCVALQKEFPMLTLISSPEFLSEATAAHDAKAPFMNVLGVPEVSDLWVKARVEVSKVLPYAHTLYCGASEAEMFKYTHNAAGLINIVFFNVMHDFAAKNGINWEEVEAGLMFDPFIAHRYAKVVDKNGRGAGGACFPKDFAAFVERFSATMYDPPALHFLQDAAKKNAALLKASGKSEEIIKQLYK